MRKQIFTNLARYQ